MTLAPAPLRGPSANRSRAAEHSRHRLSRLPRPVGAAAAGLLLQLGFPPHDGWLLAPIAVGLFAVVVRGTRLRGAYGLGVIFGLGFLVPLLAWSRVVGDDGWLLLAVLQALLLGVVGPLCSVSWRLPAAPLWVGTAWVLQEALRDRFPFGGFPWARLAFSQPSAGGVSPLTRLAALGGAPLVTFAVALVGGLLATAAVAGLQLIQRRPNWRLNQRPRLETVLTLGAAIPCLLLVGLLVPLPRSGQPDRTGGGASPDSSAVVAAVQGNVPRLGLDWTGQRRAVTRNHLAATQRLGDDVRSGRTPQPDLVLWPENSSDLDPFADEQAAAMLSSASLAAGRPLLVGAVLEGPGVGHVRNTGLVWGPEGYLGSMYVKRHPVPFGEYLPGRSLLQRLVGRFADDLPDDFVAGHVPGVLPIAGPTGTYRVGDVICFEVAYDGVVRDVAQGGARLIVVQTNNATFGRSGETQQQLSMSRLRAVEHGRSVAVVATSGVSALITPDGRVLDRSAVFTPDLLVDRLPLRSSRTLADRLGAAPEYLLTAVGLFGLAIVWRQRATGSRRSTDESGARGAPAKSEGMGTA